jgi:hypothetical protein
MTVSKFEWIILLVKRKEAKYIGRREGPKPRNGSWKRRAYKDGREGMCGQTPSTLDENGRINSKTDDWINERCRNTTYIMGRDVRNNNTTMPAIIM